MVQVNAIGDACPIPVIKTLHALQDLNGAGTVQTLVDNEIAVQNLTRLAAVSYTHLMCKTCSVSVMHTAVNSTQRRFTASPRRDVYKRQACERFTVKHFF